MADHRALLVENVTVFVDSTANELLGITLDDLTDAVTILIFNPSSLNNKETFKTSKGSLFVLIFLGNSLSAADDMALVVPELSLSIGSETSLGDLLGITFDKFTNKKIFKRDVTGALVKDPEGNLAKLNYDNA